MAGGVNKTILVGHLGNDPEMRHTSSGKPVTNFRIATTEVWVDKQGQRQERTEWHRIVTWGKIAENCNEYLSKGRQVYVEGRLQTRQWDDKDGNRRYTTEVVGQTVTFLGSRTQQTQAAGQALQNEADVPEANVPQETPQQQVMDFVPPIIDDDNIPF